MLTSSEKLDAMEGWLYENPYKKVMVHIADIRCTDLGENGFNRSFYMNQFVRGCAVSAMNYRGADASDEGVQDIMTWEEVIEDLKNN